MVEHIKFADIIGVANILTSIVVIFVYEKVILFSLVLFLIANIFLAVELHNNITEISFFRYVWSFVVTSIVCSARVTLISDIRPLWILDICISLLYVYFIFKSKGKTVLAVFVYTLCLSTILHGMIIGINQSFDISKDTYITATIVHKQKNGDWSGKNTFSQFDIYSPEYFENTFIGYQPIGMVGDRYNRYDIGDEIGLCFKKGLFGIKYCYINETS